MIQDHAILLMMSTLLKRAMETEQGNNWLPKNFKELRQWLKRKR